MDAVGNWTSVVLDTNAQVGAETWLIVWSALGGVVCCACVVGLCYCARQGRVDVAVTY